MVRWFACFKELPQIIGQRLGSGEPFVHQEEDVGVIGGRFQYATVIVCFVRHQKRFTNLQMIFQVKRKKKKEKQKTEDIFTETRDAKFDESR